MSAATVDINTVRKSLDTVQHPVAASSKIYGGTFVCANTSGYAVAGANTTGYKFLGLSTEQVDNSSGSNGDKSILLRRGKNEVYLCSISGVAITDIGRPVFISDDNNLSMYNGKVPVGHIVKYESTGKAWVTFDEVEFTTVEIPMALAAIADGDIAQWTAPFRGLLINFDFAVGTLVTTAAKTSTINVEIGTTNLTGGVITLESAGLDAVGDVEAGTAITAANWFEQGDVLTLEATSTTTFVEGDGVFRLTIAR